MTLSLAIALNILADLGIVSALTYVMSRSNRLAPHTFANARPALATVAPPASTPERFPSRSSRAPIAA
jgi:hypothetical protein